MSTATTKKSINLTQLSQELGGVPLSTRPNEGGETVIEAHDGTTAEALQAAVDAHDPAPPPPSPQQLLQRQIDELTDLIMEMI